jgi:elongation factor Ts
MNITAAQVQELREKTGVGMMQCKTALIESNGDTEKAIEILRKQGQATATKRAGKTAKEGKITILNEKTFSVMYEVNCETDFVARNDDFLSFIDETGKLLVAKKPASLQDAFALTSPAWGGRSINDRLVELIGKIGEKITFRRFSIVSADPSKERISSYIHGNGRIGVLVKLAIDKPEAVATENISVLGKDLAMQVAAANPIAVNRENVPAAVVEKEKEIYREQVKNSGKPEKIWDKIVEGKLNKFFEDTVLIEQQYIRDTEKRVKDRIAESAKAESCSITTVSFLRWDLGAEE